MCAQMNAHLFISLHSQRALRAAHSLIAWKPTCVFTDVIPRLQKLLQLSPTMTDFNTYLPPLPTSIQKQRPSPRGEQDPVLDATAADPAPVCWGKRSHELGLHAGRGRFQLLSFTPVRGNNDP